jgi:PAS domain S-box-containing protein
MTMTETYAAPASPRPVPRRDHQPSVAWQLALAQEFGGAFPFEWNAKSGEIIASAALKALLDAPPGQPLPASAVAARIEPGDRDRLKAEMETSLRDGGRFESEFRITLAQGQVRWVLARGRTLVTGPDGRIAGVALDITRRKKAEIALAEKEAALLASETRFRAVQETTIDGFMMLESVRDAEGRLVDFRWVYANEAAERIVGRPREWFVGRRLLQEMPGNREEGLFDAYVRVVETGAPWSREFSYRHESLDAYIRAVVGRVGDGIAVTFADLSERRRAEEKVIAAEERWRAILNTMPQMVWSARPDGFHDFYNDRWYDFTGVDRGATDGAGWAAMFHPEDQPLARERWQRSLATGETYEVEYRLRHRSGGWRWTLGRAVPLYGTDGAVERWFGTCTDIDDIKAGEARLKASEERLQLCLDAAEVVGTWEWDVQADRLVADARFARLVGVEVEEAEQGAPLSRYFSGIHPGDREGVRAAIAEAATLGTRYKHEYRVCRPDGSTAWVSARGHCVHERGRALRFSGAVFDITERKMIEEARELLAHELSHRIKNIFAVVNSLVTLSSRGYPEAQPFAEAVRARLTALGRAHEYVRPQPGDGTGAVDAQTAHGLFEELLAPYRGEGDRIAVDGCDAPVGVRAATALALVVHELATNAVKYGALSSASGHLTISCSGEGEAYRIVWQERGGPAVDGVPEHRGFGTLMSERTASAQLRAQISHAWDPAGLTVTIALPRSELGH